MAFLLGQRLATPVIGVTALACFWSAACPFLAALVGCYGITWAFMGVKGNWPPTGRIRLVFGIRLESCWGARRHARRPVSRVLSA
jgi:hypothetical protein